MIKYWDIKPISEEYKLVAWVEFCVARRKALQGKQIKVRFITREPDVREEEDEYIPF